jgi:hypothetical protein
MDSGGTYRATKAQRWLWECWLDYWRAVYKAKRPGDKLYVVVNGDLVDYNSHSQAEAWTNDRNDMMDCAIEVLEPIARMADRLFIGRGTDSHTGQLGEMEERIASDLGATKPNPGSKTDSYWVLDLEASGVYLQFTHHGRIGARNWSTPNGLNAIAADLCLENLKAGYRIPQLLVRSHMHRYAVSSVDLPLTVVHTPAWKLTDSYAHKVVPNKLASIGGLLITCEAGEYTMEYVGQGRYVPAQNPVWREEEVAA